MPCGGAAELGAKSRQVPKICGERGNNATGGDVDVARTCFYVSVKKGSLRVGALFKRLSRPPPAREDALLKGTFLAKRDGRDGAGWRDRNTEGKTVRLISGQRSYGSQRKKMTAAE